MGGHDEYDSVNKLADEVEQQLIDFRQEEASGAADAIGSGSGAALTPRLNSAYPSAAIRKPRSFYNYFGDDTTPLLETDADEVLSRFAGGSCASTEHELFVPLELDNQSAPSFPDSFLKYKP